MKYLIIIIYSICTIPTQAQSVSITEMKKAVNTQNGLLFEKILKSKGFFFVQKTVNTFTLKHYGRIGKSGKSGDELISIGKSNNQYTIAYKPAQNYYKEYKNGMKTSDYKYSYTEGTHKYYKNKYTTLMFDDSQKVLGYTVRLK